MYKKFSNRLSGGVANSRHRAPFRHLDAVELHRVGGENRASSVQSEKSRESYGESFLTFFFFFFYFSKIENIFLSYIYTNFKLNNWKLYENRSEENFSIELFRAYSTSNRSVFRSFLILIKREKKKFVYEPKN